MRYILTLIAVLGLVCGCAPSETAVDSRISVVCTSFPPYDFARNIAGDNASVRLLVPVGSDSHSYDPMPEDIIAISNADIFIFGGGESDEWALELLDSLDKKPEHIIAMMDLVNTFAEEIKQGMQGEEEGEADEHIWTSPKNAQLICNEITERLCEADKENSQGYKAALMQYSERISAVDEELRAVTQNAEKPLIFGDRFPFRYLIEEYGLDYYAAFPGCAELTEPSARTVAFLIDKVKTEDVQVIFHTEFSNRKICQTIATETGAKVRLLHSVHNLTKSEFDSGLGYIELMHNNAEAIKEALQNGAD